MDPSDKTAPLAGRNNGPTHISLVVPVRDCCDTIAHRIDQVVQLMRQCTGGDLATSATAATTATPRLGFEVVVVDDGSEDQTTESLRQVQSKHDNIRIARHDLPRGLESAGQTGLERSVGRVVLIAENQQPVRFDDVVELLRIAADESVVAARAESTTPSAVSPLVRRLRANVDHAEDRIDATGFSPVQMIRRPAMNDAVRTSDRRMQSQSRMICRAR